MIPRPPAPVDLPLPTLATGPGGIRVGRGIPYAEREGVRPPELDVYLPDGESRSPAAIFIHGGAWQRGSRRGAGPMYPGQSLFEQAAAAGLAVVSIDYRLTGEATWPAQRDDVHAALDWVVARAGELGIDPTRLGVWGESAGGHLALVLGLTRPTQVARVVAWYPPTDLLSMPGEQGADPLDARSPEAMLLGAPAAADAELAASASPAALATAEAPPVLLLHGEADTVVPCAQSRSLAERLHDLGTTVELHTYPGADHVWMGRSEVAADAARRSVEWLTD